jgi:hypothetical protein
MSRLSNNYLVENVFFENGGPDKHAHLDSALYSHLQDEILTSRAMSDDTHCLDAAYATNQDISGIGVRSG